ncbi:MAG: hypothetical protein ACKV2V_31090 [Blastocatellia bacterium]
MVRLYDSKGQDDKRLVASGRIRCGQFPVVIMTSNGEREFPPALLRRCLRLDIAPPGREDLARMVRAHLGAKLSRQADEMIGRFLKRRGAEGHLANDQLLNAVFLLTRDLDIDAATRERLEQRVMQILGEGDNR